MPPAQVFSIHTCSCPHMTDASYKTPGDLCLWLLEVIQTLRELQHLYHYFANLEWASIFIQQTRSDCLEKKLALFHEKTHTLVVKRHTLPLSRCARRARLFYLDTDVWFPRYVTRRDGLSRARDKRSLNSLDLNARCLHQHFGIQMRISNLRIKLTRTVVFDSADKSPRYQVTVICW